MEEELASYLAPAEYDFLQDDEPSQQQEEEQPEVPLAEQEDEDEDERNDQQQDDEDEEEEGDEEERGDREQTQGLQQNTVAYADIFGGDSDLSDQESGDEQEQQSEDEGESPKKKAKKPTMPYREEEPSEGEEEASDDEDAGDGEYQGGRNDDDEDNKRADVKNLKFKKKPKKAREEGEEEEGDEQPQKKRKKTDKKAKKADRVMEMEEPEEYVDPEIAKRRALHARIDNIIKKPKGTARKKNKGQQDDDLEAMNDEAIITLRAEMFLAADLDIEENEAGKFAYHKLKLLPEVVRLMQKSSLAESIVENGLLEPVRKWLEPLQDGSLPAINIQRPLFEILRTLTIDTSALRSCGIGKIVYFYTKCKRVEPFIARQANALVSDWMRPIIRNSKSLADREIEVTSIEDMGIRRRNVSDNISRVAGKRVAVEGGSGGGGTPSQTPGAQRPTNETIARRHARIPEALTATFKVAPMKDAKDRENGNGMSSSNVVVGGKMKNYKKKLIAGQQASRRV